MKLDNWLAQRAQTCPDRVRPDRRRGRAHLRASSRREATAAARRLAGARRPPRRDRRADAAGRAEYVVLVHALMKLGAVAYPLNPRLAAAEREARDRARRARAVGSTARPTSAPTEADLPLLGEHDLDAIHCRILTSGTTGRPARDRAHLRQPPLERGRLGLQPRRRADRPLALLPAALPRRRALDRDALGDLRHRRGRPRRLRRRPGRRLARGRRGHGRSRSCRRCCAGCSRPASTSPLRAILVGGGPVPAEVLEEALGARRDRRPDLRPDRDRSQVTTLAPAEARAASSAPPGGRC